MTNNFKRSKSLLMMGIFCISIIAAMSIPTSAQEFALIRGEQNISLGYNASDIEENFKPTSVYNIKLDLTYFFTATFPDLLEGLLGSRQVATIDLSVEAQQDWFKCSITPNTVNAKIQKDPNPIIGSKPIIRVTLDERAPARTQGNIKVTMKCRSVRAFGALLSEREIQADVPFTPAYLPIISVVPETTFDETSPGALAKIPIDLLNQGNAITIVEIKIKNIPSGWAVSVPSQIQLGSSLIEGNPEATVTLTVQPPYSFGYHDETESVQLEFTPYYYAEQTGENVKGRTITETINIKNRGFSIVGIEVAIIVLVIILIIVAAIYEIRKRMKKE